MGRVRRIAYEHYILVVPLFAQHTIELEPHGRATEMSRIRDQRVPVQPFLKQGLAQCDRFGGVHPVHACAAPGFLRRLDDERGPILIESISVQVEPAPFGFLEVESKSVQLLSAAKPDEAIISNLN